MDIARVDQLRRHLQENSDFHWQARYTCGTTGCAAGWAVALEYGAHVGDFLSHYVESTAAINAAPSIRSEWDFCVCRNDGNCTDNHRYVTVNTVARHARMLLGLSKAEAIAIFYLTVVADQPEADAVALLDALVHREKGELTDTDLNILEKYNLPTKPDDEAYE